MKTLRLLGLATLLSGGILVTAGASSPAVEIHLHPDRPLVTSTGEQTILVKVEAVGRQIRPVEDRTPVNLSLIIDRSGSMSGQRIEQARAGALEAVSRLGQGDVFSLVVFDHEVQTLIPAAGIEDLEEVKRIIRGIQAGGWTNIHAGMETALQELAKNAEGEFLHRAILLSDGQANRGPTSREAFSELGAQYSQKGIVVTTVGLGLGYNEHLLTSLASAGEGNHYFVNNPQDLARIFAQEIGHITSTVAQGVTIRIEWPQGVEVRRVLGREYRQEGASLEINFRDLADRQSKYSILEVNVPEGREKEVFSLLQASARYTEPGRSETRQAAQSLSVLYVDDEETAQRAVNEEVQRDYVTLARAEVQDNAIMRASQQDVEGARREWKSLQSSVREVGLNASVVAEADASIEEEEKILRSRNYSRDEILSRNASSYQDRYQQTPLIKTED